MTPYIEIVDAQLYFDDRLNTDEWDYADDEKKLKALKMATLAIDRLNFRGEMADEAQEHQFPRGTDTTVPTDITNACCEIALKLLEDIDPDMEYSDLTINHHQFSFVRNTQDRSFAQPHVVAGIPSPTAWKMLLPYLRDAGSVSIIRGN